MTNYPKFPCLKIAKNQLSIKKKIDTCAIDQVIRTSGW